jgi:gamma-glutamyl-gamma-aminobutyrate hydrolase PuuD
MKALIGVTQRIEIRRVGETVEYCDSLDQEWTAFLAAAGCMPVPLPNDPATAVALLLELPIDGLLLTGGEDLEAYGGEASKRDETEQALLKLARDWRMPVIGVCRGMQMIQDAFNVPLIQVSGHISSGEIINADAGVRVVNSYHRWGTRQTAPDLEIWALTEDGVVKAVHHRHEPLVGVMWHPERQHPFAEADLDLFRRTYARRLEFAS